MGTRGACGFYYHGQDKIMYNHFDSYPSGLGEDVVDFIRQVPVDEMRQIFDRIELIDTDVPPTPDQIEHCRPYTDLRVSEQSEQDWYCLLRKSQGDLMAFRNGLRYMSDAKDFLRDSLMCEWAYVINLDDEVFEVYKGFQEEPQQNRYYLAKTDHGYYNVKLLATFLLNDIPQDWIKQVAPEEEEE